MFNVLIQSHIIGSLTPGWNNKPGSKAPSALVLFGKINVLNNKCFTLHLYGNSWRTSKADSTLKTLVWIIIVGVKCYNLHIFFEQYEEFVNDFYQHLINVCLCGQDIVYVLHASFNNGYYKKSTYFDIKKAINVCVCCIIKINT